MTISQGDHGMKITKSYLTKIIKEELIKEYNTGTGRNTEDAFDYTQDSYTGKEDEEEIADIQSRDKELQRQDDEKRQKAKATKALEVSQADKSEINGYIKGMNRRTIKGIKEPLNGILKKLYAYSDLGKGTLDDREFADIVNRITGDAKMLGGLVADHQSAKSSDASEVFASFDGKLRKVSPEGAYSQLANSKEYQAIIKAFQNPAGQKPSTGFMGKLKGAFGFKENLTKDVLADMVREELKRK